MKYEALRVRVKSAERLEPPWVKKLVDYNSAYCIWYYTCIYCLFPLEVYYDRANQHDFICLNKDLAPSGELMTNTKFRFCFENVSKPYEVSASFLNLKALISKPVVRAFQSGSLKLEKNRITGAYEFGEALSYSISGTCYAIHTCGIILHEPSII